MSSFRGGKKQYYHHDDRGSGGFSGRHVSFKQGFGGKSRNNNRQRLRDDKFRKYVENGDVEMTVRFPPNNRGKGQRFNPMMSRRGAMDSNARSKRISLQPSPSSWYQVTLSHGKKYGRQDLMNAINSYIQPVPFVPVNVKLVGDDLSFFVDNDDTARAIHAANFKIQMSDGWKMQFRVKPSMPYVQMDDVLKEKIRAVMSLKYNATTLHLDLSRFHANEEFSNDDVFVPLNRPNMLLAVFEIIGESVPNLRSLSLSNNKIFSTEHFVILKRNAPDLKSLDLSKNKLRSLSTLNSLQGMKLEVLVLDENLLCNDFLDQTAYVREVRKIFKSLRMLDGVELPAPVDFGIEESQTRLPRSHDSFLCNPEGQSFTKQFLEQFFNMYDNETSRDGLAEAYADNAQFSMTAYHVHPGVNLNRYITESRNMKKVNHFERRSRLLHFGKMEIVRFLNTLPKTQHDLSSFSVDLLIYRPEFISLCLCGVFRETDVPESANKSTYIKAFSRTFLLVPNGSGFNIINDMLSITSATQMQISTAFRPKISTTPSISSVPTSPQTGIAVVNNEATPDAEFLRKREMVAALSTQTGMNMMWAEKCLVETNWDLNNAFYAFTEFNKIGKIPQEAFVKPAL